MRIEDAVEIQKAYKKLTTGETAFTKKNLCELLVPLRDKHALSDRQVLAIARNEMSLEEIAAIPTKRPPAGVGDNGERDAFVKLIQEAVRGCDTYWAEIIADHLIANGASLDPKSTEIPIEELDLSVRSYHCLKFAGINTVGQLLKLSDEQIANIRNIDKISFEEIKAKIANFKVENCDRR